MKKTLRQARQNAGFTLMSASKLIGCHITSLARWENDPSMVKASVQEKIASAYGLKVSDIQWRKA